MQAVAADAIFAQMATFRCHYSTAGHLFADTEISQLLFALLNSEMEHYCLHSSGFETF